MSRCVVFLLSSSEQGILRLGGYAVMNVSLGFDMQAKSVFLKERGTIGVPGSWYSTNTRRGPMNRASREAKAPISSQGPYGSSSLRGGPAPADGGTDSDVRGECFVVALLRAWRLVHAGIHPVREVGRCYVLSRCVAAFLSCVFLRPIGNFRRLFSRSSDVSLECGSRPIRHVNGGGREGGVQVEGVRQLDGLVLSAVICVCPVDGDEE